MDVGQPTLDQLRIFLAVADEGSFNKAASKLGRALSVVSYGVSSLENQLGVRLFDREGSRRPTLTAAGAALLADARAVSDETDSLVARARGIRQGLETQVALAVDVMLPSATVASILRDFQSAFPTVDLRLHVEALGAIAALVWDGKADLGVAGPDIIDLPHIGRTELQPVIDAIPTAQRGARRAVFAYASVLFGWAYKRGDITQNPLAGMAKPEAPKARDRVLSDEELTKVWEATGKLGDPFAPFFRLLILTGQRRSEVAGINWAELDRTTTTWTIPADRAKNGVAHIVPLASEAVAELDRLALALQEKAKEKEPDAKRWPKAGFVLTTTGRTPISGITKAKTALDEAVTKARKGEALPHWRIHDLRRTMATGFQRLGVRFEVTEATLNHISGAKGGVAGIYQKHDWKEEKRSALEAWARHVAAIIKPADKDNVVSLGATVRLR